MATIKTLNDFVKVMIDVVPSWYEISGILRFMAIDRLTAQDNTHLARRDLESFFWFIILFTSHHHEDEGSR